MPTHDRTLPPAPRWKPPSEPEPIAIDLKTITPLFGGGYEAREVDPDCVVRPAAIRGHLRFWWRATAGARYANAEELFQAEEKLWGSAAKRGAVAITVTMQSEGTSQDLQKSWPLYALQPFQGASKGGEVTVKPASARMDVRFTLSLSVADEADQTVVRETVAAWVRYGGIGARTRRGCGSLACKGIAAPISLPPASGPPSHASISPTLLTRLDGATACLGPETDGPLQAWKQAVEIYRDFRQKPGYARNPGMGTHPGRSRWPEPDTVRRMSGRHARGHEPAHAVEGFPRADLGLPIIFHFQGERDGDPRDHTLQGGDPASLRFASPVITKAIADVHGQYRPLVLILNSPHVWDLGDLDLEGTGITKAEIDLDAPLRKKVPPLQGLPVRDALAKYVLGQRGWEKAPVL